MKRKIIGTTGILLLILIIGQGFPNFKTTPLMQSTSTNTPASTNTLTPKSNLNLYSEQYPASDFFQSALQIPIPSDNTRQTNILSSQLVPTQTPYAENSIFSADLNRNPDSIKTPYYFIPSKTHTTLPTLNVTGYIRFRNTNVGCSLMETASC